MRQLDKESKGDKETNGQKGRSVEKFGIGYFCYKSNVRIYHRRKNKGKQTKEKKQTRRGKRKRG